MANEKGIFTIAENETLEEELISVDEGEFKDDSLSFDEWFLQEGSEFPEEKEQEAEDTNWLNSGKAEHFVTFLSNEINRIPTPSVVRGNVSKIEQALGQWKRLDSYISKALRGDYDGIVDVDFVDKVRRTIENNIDQLDDMLDGISRLKQNRKHLKRRQRRGEDEQDSLTKEAGTPEFAGIQINISAFERAIVGALINGKVSGGRNLEELYAMAKEKYDIDDRQELAIFQILADMGYPTFKDRLRIDVDVDDPTRDKDHGEWQSNYYA